MVGLSQLGEGDLAVRLRFRDHDCCQDVAEHFNENLSKLDRRVREIKAQVREILDKDHTPEQYKRLTEGVWRELCLFSTSDKD